MKKKLGIGCLTVVLVALLAAGVFAYRQQRYYDRVIAEARDMGVPMTLAELEAMYPVPPESENAAPFYQEAFALVKSTGEALPPESHAAYQTLPLVGRADPPPGGVWPEDLKAIARRYVSDHAAAIDKTRQAAARPECRFPYDFAAGPEMDLDHLSAMRGLARLLYLEARVAVWDGRPEDAVRAIDDLAAMTSHLHNEPLLIGQMVASAVWFIVIDAAADTAVENAMNDAQLAAIADAILRADDPGAIAHGLSGELAVMSSSMAGLGPVAALFHSETVDWMLQIIRANHEPTAQATATLRALEDEMEKSVRFNAIARLMLPPLFRVHDAYARPLAYARVVTALGAIERFRLAEGKAPFSLDALVPAYLDAVPIDPFDGKELRYIPNTGAGYLLYSIGVNRVDDNGEGAPRSQTGDIVVTVRP